MQEEVMTRPSTPCIQICRMEHGVCVGCFRVLQEIARWSRMSEAERQQVMTEVLPLRRQRAGNL